MPNTPQLNMKGILAIITTIGAFLYIFLLIFRSIPNENRDIITTLGGTMIGTAATLMQSFFNSQKESKNEQD